MIGKGKLMPTGLKLLRYTPCDKIKNLRENPAYNKGSPVPWIIYKGSGDLSFIRSYFEF